MKRKGIIMNIEVLFFRMKEFIKGGRCGSLPYDRFRSRLISLCSFFGEDTVFYINGSDVLPAPLETSEEAEIIEKLKNADERTAVKLKNKLVERNLRLVVYIAKRFENTGIGIEDLISIGTMGLMKAINTFNTEKNIKLATYASRCIENEILMFIRKNAKSRNDVSLDEPLNVDWDGNELLLSDVLGTDENEVHKGIEEEEERSMLRNAVSRLKRRDKTIIELRFGLTRADGKEMTQKEVAELLGISQSYISRLEKRIISNLKKEIIEFYK